MTDRWWHRAACKGQESSTFFPGDEGPNGYRLARGFCARCPVTQQCLDDAMRDEEQFGMRGGLTANERDDIKARNAQPVAPTKGHGDKPGTVAGFWREKRAGLPPCLDCLGAFNRRQIEIRAARKLVKTNA